MKKELLTSVALFSVVGGIPMNSSFESFETNEQVVYYGANFYEYEKYVNDTTTSNNFHDEPSLEKTINNLIDFMNKEPCNLIEEVSYVSYFEKIRTQYYYFAVFDSLIKRDIKFVHSIINILSYISFDETFDFERNFVLNQLNEMNVSSQEYALNTISVWRDKNLIKNLENIILINDVLQKRLNSIVEWAMK